MIDSSLYSLAQLAGQEDAAWCFNVPIYQRLYVWGDEQIKTLLTDIANAFDRGDEQFFLGGALVVDKTTDEDRALRLRRFDLIDGQQRFTTLWMLSTIPVWSGIMGDFSRIRLQDRDIPRLHFSIRGQVNDYLASLMPGSQAKSTEVVDTQSMSEAQQLMASFAEYYQRIDGLPVDEQYLAALADYVYRKVFLVVTMVPEGMDLNKLFEVINNRGVQLQHHEILKARLLSGIPSESRQRYGALWNACADMSGFVERNLCAETGLEAHQLGELYATGRLQEASAIHELLRRKMNASHSKTAGRVTLQGSLHASMSDEDVVESEAEDNADKRLTLQAIVDDLTTEDERGSDNLEDPQEEAPWARSIIGFPLFLQHVLRIWLKDRQREDLPRLLDRQLLTLFEGVWDTTNNQASSAARSEDFIDLLWRMRVIWDEYVIKWVDQGDEEVHQICQTSVATADNGKRYINRSQDNSMHQGLSLLQSMLYHSQEMTTHYWLTPFLYFIHQNAKAVRGERDQVGRFYDYLCYLDNHLLGEITGDTLVRRTRGFMDDPWRMATALAFEEALQQADGTGFAHYWFYKLDFVLWSDQKRHQDLWKNFRFTAKNSVEHISPQNPQETDTNRVSEQWINRFGNLALVSRGINSEYGNKPFNEKRQMFLNKKEAAKRPDSLKMDLIYRHAAWSDALADAHQEEMLDALRRHYDTRFGQSPTLP